LNRALIVFSGPPCSWKSTLARLLSERTRLPHIDMDSTRARLIPESAHTRSDRRIAYRAMHFAAEILLHQGGGIILDAPYGHLEDRSDLAEVARKTGSLPYLVQCKVSLATALDRFGSRPRENRLDLTAERVARLVLSFPYYPGGLVVDTDREPLDHCLQRIEGYVGCGTPVDADAWSGRRGG
jgi:predicted kinase